jgi:hypothetical protein
MGSKEDTEIITRETHRFSTGTPIIVMYKSNRGNKSKKEYSGEIISVPKVEENKFDVVFYDEEEERKVTVEIRETIGQSRVLSQKTDTKTNVGVPIKVICSDDVSDVKTLEQQHILNKREGDHDFVTCAAKIMSNKKDIKWIKSQQTH